MVTEKMMKLGFLKDENSLELKRVLKNNTYLKEVHMDVYPENPLIPSTSFMLLLRASKKNALVSNDGDRVILKKNDKDRVYFVNILLSKISECFFKDCEDYCEFILNVQNIYYRITVLN